MSTQINDMAIALGGNLADPEGSPQANLTRALVEMAASGLVIRAISRFFATPCFPAGAGPDYVNAAAIVRTAEGPRDVLARLHAIEAAMGRVRTRRWGERGVDLDLIAAQGAVLPDEATFRHWAGLPPDEQRRIAPDTLILPHPRLAERAFVLVPLADVAPDWVHPVSGLSVRRMLEDLPAGDRADIRAL
ncbi:MAG: 2-amino-4-hydroxy-6-hydroxymethyldihydropteridine diphosphokinase [Rhodobacteraceae bacterium]|nr:MAG: 2-amino-4-hydroxy-6-hydroxymethyldihydropteridine diphosphokinase [Paracoccaceae bacterium]